jgi:hypothetical protein
LTDCLAKAKSSHADKRWQLFIIVAEIIDLGPRSTTAAIELRFIRNHFWRRLVSLRAGALTLLICGMPFHLNAGGTTR